MATGDMATAARIAISIRVSLRRSGISVSTTDVILPSMLTIFTVFEQRQQIVDQKKLNSSHLHKQPHDHIQRYHFLEESKK